MHPLVVLAILISLGFAIYKLLTDPSKAPKNGRALPGPKPKPFVGNAFDIPKVRPEVKLWEMSKKYGPLFKISVFGQDTYVISNEKVVTDLLRKKGDIYINRPAFHAANMLVNKRLTVINPVDHVNEPERTQAWKNGRKFKNLVIGPSSMPKYSKTQNLESSKMVRDLIRSPPEYSRLFERYAGSIIFRLTYGKSIETGRESYLERSIKSVMEIEECMKPGNYLVDIFPSLKYLPTAIAPFKRHIRKHGEAIDSFYLELQEEVRQEMIAGKASPSFQKTLLENQESIGLSELDSAHVLGSLYGGGATTSALMFDVMLLKLVLHPEWQDRLHHELDEQVGSDRMPSFDDIPNLPTVRAFIKEVIRLTSIGLPRRANKDDVYGDYFIPAGTTIYPNYWAIARDPEIFVDPETFNPERWLSPEYSTYKEPLTRYPEVQNFSGFGFGRRICPGQYLAERTLNIGFARLAWACQVSKKIDSDGNEIEVPLFDYNEEFLPKPNPFQFELKVRDEKRLRVLDAHLERAIQADPLKERTTYNLERDNELNVDQGTMD